MSRTVADLSDFLIQHFHSQLVCLKQPFLVCHIGSQVGVCLRPTFTYPEANHLAGVLLKDAFRTLGRSNDQSKRRYSSSQQSKPLRKTWYACAPRPILDVWKVWGAFNSTSGLSLPRIGINRTGSSPVIVTGPPIKLRARAKGRGYLKATFF